MENKLKVYELLMDENDDKIGIRYISIVTNPAIEANFIKFSIDTDIKTEEYKTTFKVQDAEKRYLLGPVCIPDIPIYRKEVDTLGNITSEYYVTMSKDTIEKVMRKFMKNGFTKNIDQNHSVDLKDVYIIENWIIGSDPKKDKSSLYGLDYPEGTWMTTIFCENEDYWNQYLKGKNDLNGFSIDGMLNKSMNPIAEMTKLSSHLENEPDFNELADILIDFLNKME